MLGLTADTLQFQCFSKDHGVEKPDCRIFRIAIQQAQNALQLQQSALTARNDFSGNRSGKSTFNNDDPLLPSQVLHVGNDYKKDFVGASRAGMHAVLFDRYGETERADEWRRRGAVVLTDLMDLVQYLGECHAISNDINKPK